MSIRAFLLAGIATVMPAAPEPPPPSLHALTVRTLEGKPQALAAYRGKVVLVVNVASACGLTPQYAGLQKLHEAYRDRGLVVLGFPCNQFAGQEPGTAEQIQAFCRGTYGVTFPMMEKVDVKGPAQSPVYRFLTAKHPVPAWNFAKYLVGRNGQVIQAFSPRITPEDGSLVAALEAALK